MKTNYEQLKKDYPEVISINQFYQICHIAKRSAVYLLENGIVPYTDTGKLTWKYKIKLDDVIAYLEKREKVGSMIPRGVATNKKKYPRKSSKTPAMFRSYIQTDDTASIKVYFEEKLTEAPDVMTPEAVGDFLGFHTNTVRRKIRDGVLPVMNYYNTYIIPKGYLLDFLGSPDFASTVGYSPTFKSHLNDFKEWSANHN